MQLRAVGRRYRDAVRTARLIRVGEQLTRFLRAAVRSSPVLRARSPSRVRASAIVASCCAARRGRRSKQADKELKELVAATGTTLMDLHGIGPSGAARLLVEVGDITRFPTRAHFASWNGTAPIDAAGAENLSGQVKRLNDQSW